MKTKSVVIAPALIPAAKLLHDILSNTDERSLADFLEIQCGFADDEAQSWIADAKNSVSRGYHPDSQRSNSGTRTQ